MGNKKRKLGSIRTRMMGMLLLVNVAIILLLSTTTYAFYRDTFVQEIASARADVSRQIAERTKQFKANLYTVSNLYYTDPEFRAYTRDLSQENSSEFRDYMEKTTRQVIKSFGQDDLNFYVVYLSADGIGYCSRSVSENYDYMNPEGRLWYRDLSRENGGIVDVAGFKDDELGIRVFSAARTVLDETGDPVGYLMVNADERYMYQMYHDVILGGKSEIYVTTDKGQIVSSSKEKIVGYSYFNMQTLEDRIGDRGYMIADIAGEKALFTRYCDPESKFTIFEEIPLESLLNPLAAVQRTTVLLAALALVLGTLLAWHFSDRIARPIRSLCAEVKCVEEGDLNHKFFSNHYSEVDDLSQGMDKMLSQIRGLIADVQQQEEQKRKMELNWLQAQINPHFIYNTLFSIKCMVEMERNEDAATMLTLFIQMLRDALSSSDKMITVKEQMEGLQQYLALQKLRYENAFDGFVEYDDAAADCYIPKLLIQPLAENAIQHGIEISGQGGMITVIARRQGDAISIEVEDNGVGMTKERIAEVMDETDTSGKPDRPHIGVRNIHERIRLYFGEPWGLTIESEPGEGTKITIRVPAVTETGEGKSC